MLIIAAIIALFATQSAPASDNAVKAEPVSVEVQGKSPAPSMVLSPNGNQ